jgi:hypothetical protein
MQIMLEVAASTQQQHRTCCMQIMLAVAASTQQQHRTNRNARLLKQRPKGTAWGNNQLECSVDFVSEFQFRTSEAVFDFWTMF